VHYETAFSTDATDLFHANVDELRGRFYQGFVRGFVRSRDYGEERGEDGRDVVRFVVELALFWRTGFSRG
jgi:hypothetical protein